MSLWNFNFSSPRAEVSNTSWSCVCTKRGRRGCSSSLHTLFCCESIRPSRRRILFSLRLEIMTRSKSSSSTIFSFLPPNKTKLQCCPGCISSTDGRPFHRERRTSPFLKFEMSTLPSFAQKHKLALRHVISRHEIQFNRADWDQFYHACLRVNDSTMCENRGISDWLCMFQKWYSRQVFFYRHLMAIIKIFGKFVFIFISK